MWFLRRCQDMTLLPARQAQTREILRVKIFIMGSCRRHAAHDNACVPKCLNEAAPKAHVYWFLRVKGRHFMVFYLRIHAKCRNYSKLARKLHKRVFIFEPSIHKEIEIRCSSFHLQQPSFAAGQVKFASFLPDSNSHKIFWDWVARRERRVFVHC